MKALTLSLALTAGLLLQAPAQADTLLVERVQSEQGQSLPARKVGAGGFSPSLTLGGSGTSGVTASTTMPSPSTRRLVARPMCVPRIVTSTTPPRGAPTGTSASIFGGAIWASDVREVASAITAGNSRFRRRRFIAFRLGA